jgi:uncharacterized membrane protein
MVMIITNRCLLVASATLIHADEGARLVRMENKKRTWAKAVTWQISGLVMMTAANYFYLGNLQQSAGLSLLLAALGLVSYVIHERLWARTRWGIQPQAGPTHSRNYDSSSPSS